MTASEPSMYLDEILFALSGERWPVTQARGRMQPVPGLYAIYGDIKGWVDLGLEPQPGAALYVGKSEDNLVNRELDTHFAVDPAKKPRTGSSTVRRSFAALLRETLNLNAIPRNPDKPGYFANYGLTPAGDARLTAWMHERLTLTVWERSRALTVPLADVEVAVIHHWMPPLNIKDNPRPLSRLALARKTMSRQAASAQFTKESQPADPVGPLRDMEMVCNPPTKAGGPTPVELARELQKSPKTIRQALRDKYGKLPFDSDRWGALTPEQEDYLRARFH